MCPDGYQTIHFTSQSTQADGRVEFDHPKLEQSVSTLKCLLTSDTHGTHSALDIQGTYDVLIHAGDFSNYGRADEIHSFMVWLNSLDQFKDIIYIAGNHDLGYHNTPQSTLANGTRLHYLYNSSVTIKGVKFYGSPYTPRFFDWAFMYDPIDAEAIWSHIPRDTEVLITHGPPHGIFDKCPGRDGTLEHAGCPVLRRVVDGLPSVKLHLFGHIHEGYGLHDHQCGRVSVNASAIYGLQRRAPIKFGLNIKR